MMCRITRTQGCLRYTQIQTWRAFCWFYKSCCPSNIGFETRTIAKLLLPSGHHFDDEDGEGRYDCAWQ